MIAALLLERCRQCHAQEFRLCEGLDIVVIHDAGAHGHAMGFNYNGKLRSAELLLRENGDVVEIRRAETVQDYFATLDFDKLEKSIFKEKK